MKHLAPILTGAAIALAPLIWIHFGLNPFLLPLIAFVVLAALDIGTETTSTGATI